MPRAEGLPATKGADARGSRPLTPIYGIYIGCRTSGQALNNDSISYRDFSILFVHRRQERLLKFRSIIGNRDLRRETRKKKAVETRHSVEINRFEPNWLCSSTGNASPNEISSHPDNPFLGTRSLNLSAIPLFADFPYPLINFLLELWT